MKKIPSLVLALVAFSPLFAQAPAQPASTAPAPQEVVVKIQQQQIPPPQTTVEKANEWVTFGKNLGSAFDAGLTSLSDHAEKFSKTDAGRFTMAVIAWKVAGRDVVDIIEHNLERAQHLFVGVPILVTFCIVSIWFWRRNFMPRRVLVERSGPFWNRTNKWQIVGDGPDWDQPAPWFMAIIPLIVAAILLGTIVF